MHKRNTRLKLSDSQREIVGLISEAGAEEVHDILNSLARSMTTRLPAEDAYRQLFADCSYLHANGIIDIAIYTPPHWHPVLPEDYAKAFAFGEACCWESATRTWRRHCESVWQGLSLVLRREKKRGSSD